MQFEHQGGLCGRIETRNTGCRSHYGSSGLPRQVPRGGEYGEFQIKLNPGEQGDLQHEQAIHRHMTQVFWTVDSTALFVTGNMFLLLLN